MHKRIPKAEPKQAKIKPEVNQKTGDVETDVKPMVFMTSFCARCKNDDPKLKHTFLCETRIKELELSNKLAFHKFILDNILIKTVSEKGKRFAKIIILQGLQNVEKYYDVIMTCDTEEIDK